MKAIKFVILGAGIIGLISFFLPYFKLKVDDKSISPSAMDVMKGLDVASKGAKELEKGLEEAAELDTSGDLKKGMGDVQELLNLVKGIVLFMFAPALLFVAIGGVGAARGKLERLGGVGAMIVGIIGLATHGLAMAGLSDPKVKEAGMAPGVALYLMMIVSTVGVVCGLLTLIKPDRGGKFA